MTNYRSKQLIWHENSSKKVLPISTSSIIGITSKASNGQLVNVTQLRTGTKAGL